MLDASGVGYMEWNNRLAKHLFTPEHAGKRVFVAVTEKVIRDLGVGVDVDDFVAAVKSGPPWATRSGLCQRALAAFSDWRARGCDYPPYVAYLSLFVLAAEMEGDFRSYAYYPRLHALLGDNRDAGMPASFDRMLELWDDLERWSVRDCDGALGVFTATIVGGWIHVGLPASQVILSAEERQRLPVLFARSRIDPSTPPTDSALATALCVHNRGELRPRTLDVLRSDRDSGAPGRDILLDAVLEQLRDWDGTVCMGSDTNAQADRIYGALRLALQIDRTALVAKVTLRCKASGGFPTDGLDLHDPRGQQHYCCSGAAMGWSSPIALQPGGMMLDAASLDWLSGQDIQDTSGTWHFRLPASALRLFVGGQAEGLPGYIEVQQLQPGVPFMIAAHRGRLELVGRWGAEGCTGFERLPVSGLPAEWCLFRADGAHSDDLVRQSLPMLAFPSTLRLRFDGGVRHAGGPWYFRFAPPRITVEGSAMNVELTCNGAALRRDLDTGSFVLPPNLTGGPQYKVEAHMGDRIARRNLFLLDDFPLPAHLPVRWFDRHDQQLPEDSEPCVGYAGALARHPFEARFPYENLLPLSGSAKVYLLGRKPDEVRVWPRDPLPREWSPIWAIRAGKHCEAIFCGTGLDEAGPQALPPGGRPHAEWKEALWFLRKRTAPPHHRALHALLRLYQEVARRV